MARKVEGQPESASSSPLIESSGALQGLEITQGQQPVSKARCDACRARSRRQTPLSPRFGREAALGGSAGTGDRAYAAGWVSRRIRCVARRGGPAVYAEGHLHTHCWTPLRRPLVPIPIDLRCHGSARYHLRGHASSLRAIDIFFLPHYFEARRAPGSQRHDLLRAGSSTTLLVRRLRPRGADTLCYPSG